MHRTRNAAYGQPYRGFESLPLRHPARDLRTFQRRSRPAKLHHSRRWNLRNDPALNLCTRAEALSELTVGNARSCICVLHMHRCRVTEPRRRPVMRCILVNDANLKTDACCTLVAAKRSAKVTSGNSATNFFTAASTATDARRNAGAECRQPRSAGQLRDTTLMTIRCDHCRGTLGRSTRRYCQMRFCSPACVEAYQHRLDEHTKVKIAAPWFRRRRRIAKGRLAPALRPRSTVAGVEFPEPIARRLGMRFGGIATPAGALVIVFLQLISWLNDEAITLRACLPDCSGAAHVAVRRLFF